MYYIYLEITREYRDSFSSATLHSKVDNFYKGTSTRDWTNEWYKFDSELFGWN